MALEEEQPPEAVDDARHRGHEVDEGDEGLSDRSGATSVMNSAVPSGDGKATETATRAMSTVPVRTAAMPNSPRSGCQAWVVMNPNPATRSAWSPRNSRNEPTAAMMARTLTPAAVGAAPEDAVA